MEIILLREKTSLLSLCDVHKAALLKIHKWLARIMFLLCVGMFHAFFTRTYLEPIRYEFYTFLNLTPKSVCLLSGLWLSTTRLGSKFRVLTSILLLPSFSFVFFMDDYLGRIAALASLLVILWSYWIVINKERLFNSHVARPPEQSSNTSYHAAMQMT
jgi:hypothetical protein